LPLQSDPELFVSLYQQNHNFSFLKQIDGFFAACFYDTREEKLHLISDRYGMRRLYWTVYKNALVWSGELKAFLALPDYQPQIDTQTMEDFLGLRYFIGEGTWFAGVELVPAATVLTWDFSDSSLARKRYWWWNNLQPLDRLPDEGEIIEEFGRLFIEAVRTRARPGERVGLTLSGGLDSRAILATLPSDRQPYHTVTYGKQGCDDIRIAARVAKIAGAESHPVDMNAQNWFLSRFPMVWEVDASSSLQHMHLLASVQQIKRDKLFDINLHGLWGDAISGGLFFEPEKLVYFVNKRLGLERFALSPEHQQSVLARFRDYYTNIDSSSYIMSVDNRVRCFGLKDTHVSTVEGIESRLPFLDNKLQEFMYILYRSQIKDYSFYHKMLLKQFPKFYTKIPWQSTGKTITSFPLRDRIQSLNNRIQNKIKRTLNSIGIKLPPQVSQTQSSPNKEFSDYENWLRQPPSRSLYDKILNNPHAYYREYLSPEQIENIQKTWSDHLNGKNLSDKISLTVTLELWLQQVFAGKYRADSDVDF
ncbi:MAG: asparagine synthase-related protein, partial [Spirulina sp.]